MPFFDFQDRQVSYATFGSHRRLPGRPTYVVLATEYRDAAVLGEFYGTFDEETDIVVLESTNLGQSPRLGRPLTQDETVAEAVALCAHLDIRFPLFVGYCANVENAFLCASAMPRSGVVALSPLMRTRDGRFVDYMYNVLKKDILEANTSALNNIMNFLDPHTDEFDRNRMWPIVSHHNTSLGLQDPALFWIKTQQTKPTGRWLWDDLPDFAAPVLIIKGVNDILQPMSRLEPILRRPEHRLVLLQTSHRIFDKLPDEVRQAFVDFAVHVGETVLEAEPA